MKNSVERFMKIAIAEARKGMSKGNRPFGAAIARGGKVVPRAHSTAFSGHDVTAHAELDAIRKFFKTAKKRNLKGYALYATGEPCPMCSASIAWANLSALFIGANHTDTPASMQPAKKRPLKVTYKEIFRELGSNIKVTKGVLRKEVRKLYEEYDKKHARPR
jgi:tRNA(Arg) A34 adenosine deaminase TadA